jgi:hypothetical protein
MVYGIQVRLFPQIKYLAHFAGGFDTHGLEIGDPNKGYFLTDADPAESDLAHVETVIDQFSSTNNLHSTFFRLTVHFNVDAAFTLSGIQKIYNLDYFTFATLTFGIGFTLGGDIIWKPDDPDTATLDQQLETPFASRTFEQQVLRPDEFVAETQHCGSIWQKSGDLTFGLNFFVDFRIFGAPIFVKTFDIATFKIADFNTPPCTGMGAPPLAHLGDPSKDVTGPYAAAHPSKEVAGTLYLHTATARPANSDDKSQDDTVIITALTNNADGTNNLLVNSQGRTEEFDNVQAIYADGGEGNDSFTVKPGVTVPAEIRDGDGNDHLEYGGSGSASLYAGNGTNTLIGGTGNNTLVSGNGKSTLQASGPGTLTAGDGDNIIVGGSGTQTIVVGNGNNNITFGSGDSTITLGTGANTISGSIKGGHVKIIDASSTDTDHTGKGLVDQLILDGTANPDNVYFSTGTLNGSPAVQIDDGTANSTWGVTAKNINTISFNGAGNSGAVGRDGDNITIGDLSPTGVATVNVNPNRGLIPNDQKDALIVLGTTHADNIAIDAATNQAGVTLGVAVTGLGYTVNLAGMDPADDTLAVNGNGGNDTITVGNNSPTITTPSGTAAYPRPENVFSSLTIQGGAGTSTQVVLTDDADFTLTDTSLTRSTGGTMTLDNIARAKLTGGASVNKFHLLNWTGTADLDGVGNSDSYQVDFKGSGSGIVNVTDTGSASNLDTLTVNGTAASDAILISSVQVARGTEQVNYAAIEKVTVNGAVNLTGTAADTFNVTSTSEPTTVNGAVISAGGVVGSNVNVFNVGSRAPAAGGIVDTIKGPLVVVGAGPDTMNVDDTGSTAPKSGTLTPTTLTGLNMGTGGVTYSGLTTLTIQLGSGGSTLPNGPVGNTFTINDINLLTQTSVDGGVSNNDTANVTFAADFKGRLDLTAFEHGSVTVNGSWYGTLNDPQPGHLEVVNIVNGSMTPTGVLQVGSLDTMTIGPAHLSVGQDIAGQIGVSGTLGSLRVAGGTPGSITAGHIGTVSVYGGFGPVVLQITENGVQRRVEEATPANSYPLPNPNIQAATSPYATVNAAGTPSYINIQYVYESGTLANPQWTARISNNVSTGADQYDLSLVTYNDWAKFNLARLDAAGISGVRNVAIEGDVLKAVSSQAANFFQVPGANGTTVADSTPAGVRLLLDKLAGVGVRDYLPAGYIQAMSIQGLAFGSYTTPNGSLATGSAANGNAAAGLLVSGTAIVQANDTFRVPFADLATQQVVLFLATATGGGGFSNANVSLVVQGVPSPNAAGTGNTITPSNVARGAATALVAVSGIPAGSVIQTISLRGDGASIQTSQYIASAITSTGPLGDLQLHNTLGMTDVTAPSIFGSILVQGPITGTIQTTGLRTDPITSVVRPVSADLGNVYVASSSHGPYLTVTTIQTSTGGTGRIISRDKLLSQVQLSGGFSGLVAAQGDIGTIVGSTRLGGILIGGTLSGQIVTLGKAYGDLVVSGGSQGGRIAAQGGFLGNVTINGSLDAASVIISGGELGDVSLGTYLTVNGTNYGIIAAEGPTNLGKPISTGPGGFYQANIGPGNPSKAAIDAVFTKNGQSLAFDLAGLDLGGLAVILADLEALKVSNGQLTGPVA